MPTEKGKFSAEISQSVIDEALNSVRRAGSDPSAPATDVAPPPAAADPSAAATAEEGVSLDVAEPEAAAPSASSKEVAELKLQLELSQAKGRELMEKLRDEHERTLRATADLENYRKRALKEKEEVQRFGVEKLLKDFLPVLDNLDRALEHGAKAADLAGLQKGVEMTRKLAEDSLARQGMKSFSAMGKLFDPRLHEAMSQVETADAPPNTVVYEMVRGYTLHDRLVRPALVTVAKALAAEPAPAAVEQEPAASEASETKQEP